MQVRSEYQVGSHHDVSATGTAWSMVGQWYSSPTKVNQVDETMVVGGSLHGCLGGSTSGSRLVAGPELLLQL